VAALSLQVKSLEEVVAAKPTASFDAQVPESSETAGQFIWWLYSEIKALQR
jgi:cyclase